ncbi:MAG: hypothetical protein GY696_13970, partial [Gammaproteobacteria bacterium]|nr:hypothetical protein [Gammaproteobacteria bacterium]
MCFVVLYLYVLCFMIKSELRKQPFYLQLICLGCHEIVSLVISGFNLVSSLISVWTVIPVQFFLAVGGAYAFLGSVNIWIMLEIAFVRFFSVFFPLHAQGFLAAKRLLRITTMLAYFYAGAYVGLVNMTWPVYIPQHMIMFPARETKTSFLGPSATMLFQAVPIIGSVVCYLATAIKLFHLSILAKRKARRVGAITGTGPTRVNNSSEGVPNLQSATKRRAQWTMVKLAVILFSVYLSQILIMPII